MLRGGSQRIQRLIGRMSSAVAILDVSQEGVKTPLRSQLRLNLAGFQLMMKSRMSWVMTGICQPRKHAPIGSVSLDEPFGDDNDSTLGDLLSEEEELSQSYREDGSLTDDIQVALSFLDNRERKVLSMRFGIGADDSMKLDDIADVLNVSGESRQLES